MVEKGEFRFWSFDKKCHYYSDLIEQMSATDIKNCQDCEYKFFHKLTQEVKPPKNVYLVMGSVFHETIEQDLRYFVKSGKHYKWLDLQVIFSNIWEKEKKSCNFDGKLTEEQAKLKCSNYIYIYSIKILSLLYPLDQTMIEKFFCVPISYQDKMIKFTGKIDVICKNYYIVDHKTAGNFSKWENEKMDNDTQGLLYYYLMKMQGLDIKGFHYNVVSRNEVRVYEVPYNELKISKILTFAFDVAKRIKENNILRTKNIKVCQQCDWNKLNICKESLFKEVL